MKSDHIQVTSINDEVYNRLKHQITHAQIAPGEKISIRQIAEAFGVSTMPVREALRKLQAEGFVHFETRSVIVRSLSQQEVKEIFAIRERLECLATEWAIGQVKPEDIEALRETLDAMDDKEVGLTDWQRMNREFHLQLYELSGSPKLIQLITNVWDMVEPYMHIYTSSVSSLQTAQTQHHEMLKLVELGELEELLDWIRSHLSYTCEVILEALPES
ncbi:GntR family transcriptional regulator [Paenibacillus sp. PK3_47]|uniref:GntR family transcriptional regulator n=1 Tax=Paenibacillus sp. PK3_47 TaxID=2072642 RepID=UPI00201DABEA|nr:GntR family transcriptional regulator [Paenibacillus sp. PK3_47]